MNTADRLILWNSDDPEFPQDAWAVGSALYLTCVSRAGKSYDQYLRELLADPELTKVQGILGAIALRHGLEDDEGGRLAALHSIMLAEVELHKKRLGIVERIHACISSGDQDGQTQAHWELVRLAPCCLQNWLDLVDHLEKFQSAAAALECLRAAEPYHRDDYDFRAELLRLICSCGTREEALAEGRRIREQFGDFAELIIQSDEDFLLAWRADPAAEGLRASFAK